MIRDYVAVDVETTGINSKDDKIIEIGMVRVRDLKIVETYESLINPRRSVPEKVVELTGITNEKLVDAPYIEDKIDEILQFLGDDVLLGHKIIFDYSFISKAAVNSGKKFAAKGIDTLKLAREILLDLPKKGLEYLCCHFGINDDRAHRALYDATKAHEIYGLLFRENPGKIEEYVPKELVFKVKKDQPITKSQNEYLNNLLKYHKIDIGMKTEDLTRSQASRIIDNILSHKIQSGNNSIPIDGI